jgi:molybdate transport system permease protein
VLRRPVLVWGGAALAAVVLIAPLLALVAQVPYGRFWSLLTEQSSLDALRISLETSSIATVLCVVLGLPLALTLDRLPRTVRGPIRTLALTPMVLPPVVGGMALLAAFGRHRLLGESMNFLGIDLAFTTAAVVLAQTFVALPFFVISIESETRRAGRTYDDVARAFGAGPWTGLWHVTLPVLGPGIVVGAVMSFARALGEYGATITFAGSLQGSTTTMPMQIYLQRFDDTDAAVALSVTLMVIAVAVIACVRPRPVD